MIDRITKNEERLDSILSSIKNLEKSLEEFHNNQKNLFYLNKYYGSDSWFQDKEKLENGDIPSIKAGVLSEDAVWNMNEDMKDLLLKMKKIIKQYDKE